MTWQGNQDVQVFRDKLEGYVKGRLS